MNVVYDKALNHLDLIFVKVHQYVKMSLGSLYFGADEEGLDNNGTKLMIDQNLLKFQEGNN